MKILRSVLALTLALSPLALGCGDEGGEVGDTSKYKIPAAVQNSILAAHNTERASITSATVPALTWSADAEAVALKYAAKLESDGTCTLIHNPDRGKFGENLAMKGKSTPFSYVDFTAAEATGMVNAWIAEKADYNYATNKCKPKPVQCGHYTQVVWKTTTTVGCAVLACKYTPYNALILICNYAPPGNWVGQKPY